MEDVLGEHVDITTVDVHVLARKLLQTIREPTHDMCMSGGDIPISNRGQDHRGMKRRGVRIGDMAASDAWREMIDHALKPRTEAST
jgi:hypothetical protein